MANQQNFKRQFSRAAIIVSSLSLLMGNALARNPDEPPQHILEIAYKDLPSPLPKYQSGSRTGFYNLDFFETIDKADTTQIHDMFWASGFYFSGHGGAYGYTGLQVAGVGDMKIIFSIWGATIDPANKNCNQGQEVGAVASCIMPYAWKVGTKYRFRIWATGLSKDVKGATDGEWWSAFVLDTATNKETFIARLKVPADYNWIGTPQGFVEYFGALPDKCATAVPAATAIYGVLQTNAGNYSSQATTSAEDPGFAACATNLLVSASHVNSSKDLTISTGQAAKPKTP